VRVDRRRKKKLPFFVVDRASLCALIEIQLLSNHNKAYFFYRCIPLLCGRASAQRSRSSDVIISISQSKLQMCKPIIERPGQTRYVVMKLNSSSPEVIAAARDVATLFVQETIGIATKASRQGTARSNRTEQELLNQAEPRNTATKKETPSETEVRSIFSPSVKLEIKEANSSNKPAYKPRKMFTFSDRDIRRSYTKQLDKVFAEHYPSRRSQVPRMVAKYAGREEELLNKTRQLLEKHHAAAQSQRISSKGGLIAKMTQCISTTFVSCP
jgi:hypothetical protein